MSKHLLTDELNDYLTGSLTSVDLLRVDDHLAACDLCYEQVVRLRQSRETTGFDLAHNLIEEPEHLSYAQLENYADKRSDEIEREIADVHLRDCADCTAALNGLFEIQNLITTDLQNNEKNAPITIKQSPLREFLAGRFFPRFGFAALSILLIALLLGVLWLLRNESKYDVASNFPTPDLPRNRQILTGNLPPNMPANTDSNTSQNAEIEKPPPKKTPASGQTEDLPRPYRDEIERVLATSRLNLPAEISSLRSRTGELMSGGTAEVPFALRYPVGKIIQTDRPQLQWQPLTGAENYVVNIYDVNFNKVAASPPLSATSWQPAAPLSRNKIYFWQVTAVSGGKEIKSPVRPAPDARFKILDHKKADELAILSRRHKNEHLFLGIMYAGAGLLDEAENEFRKELDKDPSSKRAQKFLQDVRRLKR